MKTNKSYTKRIKVTKNGKLIARKQGQNHFNAKESGQTGLAKKGNYTVHMKQKARSRFLANQL